MQRAGVQLKKYRPLRWTNLGRMNNRSHRRLLIVDGSIAFTGGFGIGDVWKGDARSPDEWRDAQVQAEGPIVQQFQACFMENWRETSPELLTSADYFPPLGEAGTTCAQLFSSHPGTKGNKLWLMFLLCFAGARERILLANSYFGPDKRSIAVLVDAAKRGVHVEIIVPGPYLDVKLTRRASRALWGDLLQNGVRIFQYQPTMYHCKYFIVDHDFASVGSANFDERSFRLNDEATLNVLDGEFACKQATIFEQDKHDCKEVLFADWARRPWREKAMECLCGILRSQV